MDAAFFLEGDFMDLSQFRSDHSRYLNASDFDSVGRKLTICDMKIELIPAGKKKEAKLPVVYFDEISKGLILRETKLDRMFELYGTESDFWMGKMIHLHTGPVRRPGSLDEFVDSILIDRPMPVTTSQNHSEDKYFRRGHWASKPKK
jgi:hypothetical protein